MYLIDINKNTGVIIKKPEKTDWKAGAETGITYVEVQTDGQWDFYLPTGERQKNIYFDFYACVSFSALNVIETIMNRMTEKNEISTSNLDWLKENGYYDANGKLNFSDRFTAKMSGTTINGNSLAAVADCIRNKGVIPESEWSVSEDLTNWDKYYSEIPEELKTKGLEFVKRFDIKYEWILLGEADANTLKKHLKQSPLQLATATCTPWNTAEVIAGCGIRTNHGTMLFGYSDEYWKIFDTYNPWCKKFANDYGIAWAMKYVVENKTISTSTETKFEYTFKNKIKIGDKSTDVIALQTLLKLDGSFPSTVNVTGYYGTITQTAVATFCKKYNVGCSLERIYVNGRWCGPKTINELNKQVLSWSK